MRHARAERRLSEYLDGALRVRDAERVEAHLLDCAECQTLLGELRRTRSLLRGLRGADEAPDLTAAVLARMERGEGKTSGLDRVRAWGDRLFAAPWSAPLATVAVGLVLLAFVPPIEVEVSIPLGAGEAAAPAVAMAPRAPAPALPPREVASRASVSSPLAVRRQVQSVRPPSRELPQRLPPASYDCWELPAFDACQEHRHVLMDLALRDARQFLARLDQVSSPARERWIQELSRYAAQDGSAPSVAASLRGTGDPRGWQLASRFEAADFAGR